MDQNTPLSKFYANIRNDPTILETLEPTIKKIKRLINEHRYQEACGNYFTLHMKGWRLWENRTKHMLEYTRQAYKKISFDKNEKEEIKNDKKAS